MRNLTYITLLLLCTITFTGQSADTPDPPSALDNWVNTLLPDKAKFSVEVNVKSDDENTKSLIESYLKRELRSLQDVEIVDTGKGIIIDIVSIEIEYKVSGNKTGQMAYAYRFSRSASTEDDFPFITNYFTENREKIPVDVRLDLVKLVFFNENYEMGIRYFQTNELKRECEALIAKFDTSVLEPRR